MILPSSPSLPPFFLFLTAAADTGVTMKENIAHTFCNYMSEINGQEQQQIYPSEKENEGEKECKEEIERLRDKARQTGRESERQVES